MKEYGAHKSWIKHLVIEDAGKFVNGVRVRWFMEDGNKVLLVCSRNKVVTYDPIEGVCRFIKFDGLCGNLTVLRHVPSLTPLKDVLIVDENSMDGNEAWSFQQILDSEQLNPPVDYFFPKAIRLSNILYGELTSSSSIQLPLEPSWIKELKLLDEQLSRSHWESVITNPRGHPTHGDGAVDDISAAAADDDGSDGDD